MEDRCNENLLFVIQEQFDDYQQKLSSGTASLLAQVFAKSKTG